MLLRDLDPKSYTFYPDRNNRIAKRETLPIYDKDYQVFLHTASTTTVIDDMKMNLDSSKGVSVTLMTDKRPPEERERQLSITTSSAAILTMNYERTAFQTWGMTEFPLSHEFTEKVYEYCGGHDDQEAINVALDAIGKEVIFCHTTGNKFSERIALIKIGEAIADLRVIQQAIKQRADKTQKDTPLTRLKRLIGK